MQTETEAELELAKKYLNLQEGIDLVIEKFLSFHNEGTPGHAVFDDMLCVQAGLTTVLAKTVAIITVQTEARGAAIDHKEVAADVSRIFTDQFLEILPDIRTQFKERQDGKADETTSH